MERDERDYPQYCISLGPVSFLRVGVVWSLDIGRVGIYGIGWRMIRGRIINP